MGPAVGDTISVHIPGALDAKSLGLDGVNLAATSDPASVNAFPAQGRIDDIRAGAIVFLGATSTPGAIDALSGTITFDGHTLDLGITYTDTTGDGVIGNAERVDQLNAAASGAGITHLTDPFVDDGDDLIFRGRAPLPDATDAELAALSPDYSDPSPQVLEVPASTSIPPQAGG
ncbi:hypothetical protein A7K94_0203285 [Modestobacter sp. VKM Ac-2676]|nr:hypothetical protein A7K94_0203285 [Modestobacter sp. VKM Ac-2676]